MRDKIRQQLINHASIRKIAETVIRDSKDRYPNWRGAAIHRLRCMTGESIKVCSVIVSEMTDN